MKFSNKGGFLLFSIAFISLICSIQSQENDPQAVKRTAPRRPVGKSSKTTTTTLAPAEDDGEYPDGENPDQYGDEGEDAISSSTTTTEAPKKVGPVIRPFRSNDDFLNSLKRRQMDAKKHRAEHPTPKSKQIEINDDESPAAPVSAPAPAKSSKSIPANRRKFTKSTKQEPQPEDTIEEGSEQQEKEESKLKRPHPRLTLRKRA